MTLKVNLQEGNKIEKRDGERKENMVMREGEKNAYHDNDEKNNENDDVEKSSQLVTNSDPVLDRAVFDRYVRNYIL